MKRRLITDASNQGKVANHPPPPDTFDLQPPSQQPTRTSRITRATKKATARQANKRYKNTEKTGKKCVQNNSTTDRGRRINNEKAKVQVRSQPWTVKKNMWAKVGTFKI